MGRLAPLYIDLHGSEELIELKAHPRARRIKLKVIPPGRVEVVVPPRFNRRDLHRFIDSQRPWLATQLARLRSHYGEQGGLHPPFTFTLPCVDETWRVEESGQRRLSVRNGCVYLPATDDWARSLGGWLSRHAAERLKPWLYRLAELHGLEVTGVAIRAQRTRWGSCSSAGRINLNRNLLFLAQQEVEYLMIHELAHLRHMNHSKQFWAQVAEMAPDYRRHDRALRSAMERVPLWARAL